MAVKWINEDNEHCSLSDKEVEKLFKQATKDNTKKTRTSIRK